MMRVLRRPQFSAARSRGVATIEAAICIPLLLALMFATVELGRAFVQYTTLAGAVRQASRYIAGRALRDSNGIVRLNPADSARTRNLVVFGNEVGVGSPRLPGLSTTQVNIADVGENNVRVTAEYPYQSLFGGVLPFVRGGNGSASTVFNLRIEVTMRAL